MTVVWDIFVRDMNRKVTVLVATSGDTGGAVADGFFGIDGVQVVILYPKGKVSRVQEKATDNLWRKYPCHSRQWNL